MSPNPYIDADPGLNTDEILGLEGAVVSSAQSHASGDDVGHHVQVRTDFFDDPVIAEVIVTQNGDTAIPEEGDNVIIAYRVNGIPIILGSRYANNDTVPDYTPGERRVSASASNDSYVRLLSNGEIHVNSDGPIIVNQGSTRPVTDVTVNTQTDSDGHVTNVSLDLERAQTVYMNSAPTTT